MAREKKFASAGAAKEAPAGKLMETIVEDVIKAKAMTFAQCMPTARPPWFTCHSGVARRSVSGHASRRCRGSLAVAAKLEITRSPAPDD